MEEFREPKGIVRFIGDVKSWPPSVDEARPARCVDCQLAAWDCGHLRIHGHGLRARQQRGPPAPDAPATCEVPIMRRYHCTACGAVMCVVPASCVARKHFSGAAIAQALALWGLCGLSAQAVRERVNDWQLRGAGARGWKSLQRWVKDVVSGKLLGMLALGALPQALLEVARRAAQALCGYAPIPWRNAPVDHQAHVGYRHVS